MKILVVGIVRSRQVKRLKEEARKRNHKLDACLVSDITILCEENRFIPKVKNKSLENYDLIYLLTLGIRRWVWYAACEYLSKKGVVIVNKAVVDPAFNFNINVAKEYLLEAENDLPYPKSLIFLSSNYTDSVVKNFDFPLILKSGEGRQGKSVFKIKNNNELAAKIKKLHKTKSTIVAREFIPNEGDLRIFTVGYKAVAAMRRIPVKGDFRSNISRGGKGYAFDLSIYPDIKLLAEKAAYVNRIEIAGVDIIINKENGKPYILEVNPGPQFAGIEKCTGVNVGEKIIIYFESLLKRFND